MESDGERVDGRGRRRERRGRKGGLVGGRIARPIHPALAAWQRGGSATSVAQSWEARWCWEAGLVKWTEMVQDST